MKQKRQTQSTVKRGATGGDGKLERRIEPRDSSHCITSAGIPLVTAHVKRI